MKELESLHPIEFPHLVHELAQPLTTISGYLAGCIYRLTSSTPENETILSAMNNILQNIEYAQQIILRMKNCIDTVAIK